MKTLNVLLVVVVLAVMTSLLVASADFDGSGIVTLPEFSEAVALCGCEGDDKTEQDGFVMYCEDNIIFTINKPFENDPRVGKLKELAHMECSNFLNNQ